MNARHPVAIAAAALALALAAGCASQGGSSTKTASASPAAAAGPQPVKVKSRDGSFDGEMIGTPAPGSKFAKVKIGMEFNEVSALIGGPSSLDSHETGKRWIPFYFGNDARRMEAIYNGEGCLTFTAGNVWGGGGNELIRITADPTGKLCKDE
ncbi:MAG: hypothetical protein ACTHL8_01905 [Burkholderiaceae bacterium]